MLDYIFDMKSFLDQKGVFLCVSGPVSQELMVEMGEALRQKIMFDRVGKKHVMRIFSTLVEITQNIIRYSAEKSVMKGDGKDELRQGIIAVGKEEEGYFLVCGNMIETRDVEPLRERLTNLRSMNAEDLKSFWRRQRKTRDKNGIHAYGLGFLEMARKARKPIEFDFIWIDDEYSYFVVKIVI